MNIGLRLSLMGAEILSTYEGLCFTAEQSNSLVTLYKTGSAPAVSIQTSTDGKTWSNFTVGSTNITLANVGDKVYFRAGDSGNTRMSSSLTDGNIFVIYGKVSASGNVMSLLDASLESKTITQPYCFAGLFYNCSSLTHAPELPATTLADWCYYGMFSGCSSLIEAPELPATTLANNCYYGMFQNCTTLTITPELPSTTLMNSCYYGMFHGCTSLITATEIPATTVAENCCTYMFCNCTSLTKAPSILPALTLFSNCYESMFSGCISLTQSPELPAKTLVDNCYYAMFYECSNLSSINVNFSAWSPTNATLYWVLNVAPSGTFTCPSILDRTVGHSNIPSGWNIEIKPYDGLCFTAEEAGSTISMKKTNSAPSISLMTSTDGENWSTFTVGSTTITLANVGDKVYFRADEAGNTRMATNTSNYNYFVMTGKIAASGNVMSLLDASCQLISLKDRNYAFCYLFKNCSSLTQAPELPSTTLASSCYSYMFYGCSSLTQAPELPATTLASSCYNCMFQNCSALITAPELPATTLANYCYQRMFQGCSTLTTAPELPATTLTTNCYYCMFNSCSNLSSINVNFSAWSPTNATSTWVTGVASSGTFTCLTALPETRGTGYIPTNWTIVRK